MKKRMRKNQQGSVLLAVVCMTTFCLTLAMISLTVVRATTADSSDNVQRTQAKITAEAALTEFIDSYGGTYEELKTYAQGCTVDSPYVLDVQMDGDSTFDTNFGKTQLKIYEYGSGGFKVDAECTYSTQTQTASIYFAAETKTPYLPSNALETSDGANIVDGVATPVEGSTYIEKGDTALNGKNAITTSNDAKYTGHFYSDYNILLQSNSKVLDGTNKSESTKYVHPDRYFQQAPTLVSAGYITFNNSSSVTTEVGKTDVNGKNSDDEGYDSSNLSNMDGYICAYKKFCLTYAKCTIGATGKPIDVYCHGAYIGAIPSTVNKAGTTVTVEDKEVIENGFDGGLVNNQYESMTIHGNFYSYKGDESSEIYQSGAVVINNGAGTITIEGDMFVDGDIYLCNNWNNVLKVTGTLYCSGTIYGSDGGYATIATVSGGGYAYETTGTFNTSSINAGAISNTIDRTVKRNQFPEEGYDPATGNSSTTRQGMSVYDNCSTNSMFKASIEGTSDEKQGAANIAEKYAYAMTRTTSDTFVDPLTGATSAVCSTYDASANVKAIYASVMLTKDEATDGNNYLVRLTNQDIIIALPLSTGVDYGWGPQFSSYVTCKFRIDRSGITDGNNYFCYFMYYDPSDPTLCLYYDKDFSGVTLHDGKTYSFKGSTDADRANLWATLACGNHDGAPVMDYQSMGTGLSLAQNFAANIPDSIINSLDNYIMYLLPDGVGFCYGGTGRPTYIQGIIYGTLSEVRSGGPNQNTVYGQIKAKSFYPNSDKKTGVVVDVPVASDSILGYVSLKNASVTSINIQYYEY